MRYILEGSVRKGGDRIRITGQLIDATSGAHLWADRYDGQLDDIFDLQDKITASVIGAIEPSVLSAEIDRAPQAPRSLDAYDYYLKHYRTLTNRHARASAEGVRLLEAALSLDPLLHQRAHSPHGSIFTDSVSTWTNDPQDETIRAIQLARRALDNSKDDPRVLSMSGWVLATMAGESRPAPQC